MEDRLLNYAESSPSLLEIPLSLLLEQHKMRLPCHYQLYIFVYSTQYRVWAPKIPNAIWWELSNQFNPIHLFIYYTRNSENRYILVELPRKSFEHVSKWFDSCDSFLYPNLSIYYSLITLTYKICARRVNVPIRGPHFHALTYIHIHTPKIDHAVSQSILMVFFIMLNTHSNSPTSFLTMVFGFSIYHLRFYMRQLITRIIIHHFIYSICCAMERSWKKVWPVWA